MGRIITLDQNTINMIAAGEVIERPANVVKELMENSIDAGATKLRVVVEDGGRKFISVTDDGCGMDAEDLAAAFGSHTTSKIQTSSDLAGILTLGFRGEALASIASVAQVKAVSRVRDSISGNCIEIDCGAESAVSPCSADYGTTIEVRNLFYKLPARRKFLRTANTELGHITEHFTRVALARSDLDLTLVHNGRELYRLTNKEGLRQRIAELFSSEIFENLIETQSEEKGLSIFAFLGKPCISRTNNKLQYIFLNGRFIRDKFISHAIKEAYRGVLEQNRFPVVFLFIQMSPEDYDVNVHPTKIEVRFYNANLVHSQILACLREKLLATKLEVPAQMPTARERSEKINEAMAEFFKKHRPVQGQLQLGFRRPAGPGGTAPRGGGRGPGEYLADVIGHTSRAIQIHDCFIVAQTEDGFIIVDQHALHERIMYENLRLRLQNSKLEAQKLLIPETFEVTGAQADVIKANAELIEKLGIELVRFGPKSMAIQAFPVLLSKAEPLDFVRDLVDLLSDKGAELDTERLLDAVLNMAACKAAVKAGQSLSDSEIQQLLADREKVVGTSHCPHGRPTTIKFTISDLEKQFKRT